jgi:tetratricopeptide (TPR) repeat protein
LLVGLRPAPEARHRDVDALLGELRPRAWTSPRVLAVTVITALVLGVAGSSLIWKSMSNGPSCKLAAGEATAVWNPERQVQLARTFTTLHPQGAEIATRVGSFVDRWMGEWTLARTELCEMSTRADAKLEESRVAERLQCLQRRITELDGALTVLGIADSATTVDNAVDVIEHVHPATECAELVSTSPSPAEIEAAKPILSLIVKARTAENAGHTDETLAFARSAVDTARTIHSPALGAALQVLGEAQAGHGDLQLARDTYHEAAAAGAAIHEDGMVADAWIALVQLSFRDHLVDDKLRAALFSAELATTRLPEDDERHPSFHYTAGTIRVMEGRYREAITELELAIAEYQKLDANRYAGEIVSAENSLGLVYADQGDWDKAGHCFEQLAAKIRSLGADSPNLGIPLGNLGMLAAYQEHYAEAEQLLEQVVSLYAKLGPMHPLVAEGEFNLGQLYAQEGKCTRAVPLLAKAHAGLVASHGADAPVLAMVMMEQGRCLTDPREVIELETRARAIAVAHPVSVRELPEIDFVLAEATNRTRGGRARARELAASARAAFVAIGDGTVARVRMIDRWLATH